MKAIVLCTILAGCMAAAERTAHVYKVVGGRELKLYVISPPTGKGPFPAIVFYHGGGWVAGLPKQFTQHGEHLASRGMVAVQVEYRLLEKGADAPPLVCIQDAKSAMRWLRSHARELNIDPKRIASGGGSAGGHLAAFVGMMDGLDDPADDRSISARSNAMILFNPVFDNGPDGWGYKLTGGRYREFSPFHNVTASAAPAIVFVGSQDKLLPAATVNAFCAAMQKVNVRCEARIYEGQGHGFFNYKEGGPNEYYRKTLEAADGFLVSLGWIGRR